MALSKTYTHDFERLYRAWPTWPKGRTKKHLAFKAFEKAKRDFDLSSEDVDELILLIDQMKRERKSWQQGNAYGPQGLQVWLNQAGWQDEYEKVYTRVADKYDKANEAFEDRPMTDAEREASRRAYERAMAELRGEMH